MPDIAAAERVDPDSEFHNIVRAVARFLKEKNVTNETSAAVRELVNEAVLTGTVAHVYDDGAVEY